MQEVFTIDVINLENRITSSWHRNLNASGLDLLKVC
jgi:hypothetical protein